jgi:ribosomal protein S18 acetylase RimI-like enzyme
MAEIVRANVEDWELVRDIRLRALADAPMAFASRLEDERDRPAAMWRERLAAADAATFVAVEEGRATGLVTVFLAPEDASRAHLVSMWVAPDRRRTGLGGAMVDRVVRWSAERRAATLELWVTDTNDAARALYRTCGFIGTDERQPLPSDPTLSESRMIRPLPPGVSMRPSR